MANPSGERLAEALKTIFDENIDAAESFLPEKNEPSLNLRSVGRSRVVKSTKGKTKPCQQKRYPSVTDEFLDDNSDDIFGSAVLKQDSDQPANIKFIKAGIEQPSVDADKSVGSEVNSYETKNSDLSLHANAADMSLFGNENVQFNFSLNLPEKDLPKKEKTFESISKSCTSTSSIPPDEVVIEAMRLIFDENVDATRIFALEKKEPTRLNSSSHGEDKEPGRVKIKAKPKKYWSVLDALLDDDSDDIFGPAFSMQNKSAPQAEVKFAEGEVKQPQLAVEESLRTSCEFVPENAKISGKENREHIVDVSCGSSESKLIRKHESDAASDSTSSVGVPQGLYPCSEVDLNDSAKNSNEIEDQESISDVKWNLCSVEQVTKDESDSASDHAATLKVPFASSPFDSKVMLPDTEIKDLPANKKVKEISLLQYEKLENNVPLSSPNKRKKHDVSISHEELDVISSSSVSEEKEDANPCKKRKQTDSTLESGLIRNGDTELENMLTKAPNFNFLDHPGLDLTFTGCQRNVEEATNDQDKKEKFVHFQRTRPSKSKPCQPSFRFDDNEIEALFGSVKRKNIPFVETRSHRDVVKQTMETAHSVKDIDLLRISDPLLNTDSSTNAESLLNTDLLRNRKPERTENLHEDPCLADTGVLFTRSLESCSESVQSAKSGIEYPLQQTPLKSGQDGTSSFIFQLPPEFLSNAFLLCATGILLIAVPSLLLFLPVYVLALINAIFLIGVLIVGAMVFKSYCSKEKKRARNNTNAQGTSVEHLQLPEIKYFKAPGDVFQGWMNELNGSYDVSNFHISHLRSVYVSLDGSTLRLRTPKKRIPKRAIGSEGLPVPGSFIKQRFYDLSGSKVTTLPEGLVLRRLWSKKYPICIEILAKRTKKENPSIDQTGGCSAGQEVEKLNENDCSHLFLFARTCREKEEWFRRFLASASGSPFSSCPDSLVKNTPSGTSIQPSFSETKKDTSFESEFEELLTTNDDQNFSNYLFSMSKVLSMSNESVCDPQLLWINAFISRCTMDVLQESHWIEVIKRKLEKKLLTAKIPNFMDDVRLIGFDLGKEVPLICKATLPSLDDQGLWMDLEILYTGRLRVTIETKCNLLKLKGMSTKDVPRVCKSSAATNSDEEDSGESSTDDSSDNEEDNDLERQKPKVNWLLRLADRITSSRHFQSAMKIERIKKVMENVSSKSLMLSVELSGLKGTMAVNIPPPPTDRIWYGFRHMPDLEMSVEVQVGQRQITLTPLTNWIEKKLIVELERALVMPNMDDILFPLMCDHVTNVHVPPTGNPE